MSLSSQKTTAVSSNPLFKVVKSYYYYQEVFPNFLHINNSHPNFVFSSTKWTIDSTAGRSKLLITKQTQSIGSKGASLEVLQSVPKLFRLSISKNRFFEIKKLLLIATNTMYIFQQHCELGNSEPRYSKAS